MTSTALQVHTPKAQTALSGALAERGELDFGQMEALAAHLVPTGFLPDYIKTPGQALAIILTGRELGMAPMRALRSLSMVKGKVTENADSQLARFKEEGGRAVFTTLTDTTAVVALRHPNGDEHTETFTMADAERAGLTKPSPRTGEPSMFTKYPRAMLRSRAITAGLKSIGWSGAVGNYDPDEAEAFTPAGSPTNGASGVAAAAAAPQPLSAEDALARAMAMPFPFQRGTTNHGKAMGELPTSLLENVSAWIVEKRQEKNAPAFYAEELAAMRLILADRETGSGQAKLEFDDGPEGAGTVSAPSTETPPQKPNGKPAPPVQTTTGRPKDVKGDTDALVKTLNGLLAHPDVSAAAKEKVQANLKAGKLVTDDDLMFAIEDLQDGLPF